MKRHKTTYFIKSDRYKDCYELVVIHRKPKLKLLIRHAMWKAYNYKWVSALDKQYEQVT